MKAPAAHEDLKARENIHGESEQHGRYASPSVTHHLLKIATRSLSIWGIYVMNVGLIRGRRRKLVAASLALLSINSLIGVLVY